MSQLIKPEDLAHFLRSRTTADCKIAADWVEENADSDLVDQLCSELTKKMMGPFSRLVRHYEENHMAPESTQSFLVKKAAVFYLVTGRRLREPTSIMLQGEKDWAILKGNTFGSWATVIVNKIKKIAVL